MKPKYKSTKEALEITKALLQSVELQGPPTAETANSIADFIQTLIDRLEPIVGPSQD